MSRRRRLVAEETIMRLYVGFVIVLSHGDGPATTQSTTRPAVSRVIFMVDGTGSMNQCWDSVRDDLDKRIALLKGDVSFNVIAFFDVDVWGAWGSPAPADQEHRRGAGDFLRRLLL